MELVAAHHITGATADEIIDGLGELAHVLYRRPFWHDIALCRGPEGADIDFFPSKGGDVRPALALCARCDARWPCKQDALDDVTRHGVWGGTTAPERRRLRAERDAAEVA